MAVSMSVEDMEYLYLSTLLAPYKGSLADLHRRNWLNALSLPVDDPRSNADLEMLYYRLQIPAAPATWSLEDMQYEFYRLASAAPTVRYSVHDFKREYYLART